MLPSFSFVGQPETNGVIERFFRTFKEQVVHGRIFRTIDGFRDAARDFVLRYNTQWLIRRTATSAPPTHARDGSTRICRVRHSATYCPRNRVRYIISVIRNFPYHLLASTSAPLAARRSARTTGSRSRTRASPPRPGGLAAIASMTVRDRAVAAFQRRGQRALRRARQSCGTCTDTVPAGGRSARLVAVGMALAGVRTLVEAAPRNRSGSTCIASSRPGAKHRGDPTRPMLDQLFQDHLTRRYPSACPSAPWLCCNSMEYPNGRPLLEAAPAGARCQTRGYIPVLTSGRTTRGRVRRNRLSRAVIPC